MSEQSTTQSSSENSKKPKKDSKEPKSFQKGKVVKISRGSIIPDDLNPRWISPANADRLKKSIKENGLVGHLIWNKTTGHIVGGHQRLDALDSLMRTQDYELEVVMVELPVKEEVKLNVILNNQDNQGEFDFNALNNLSKEFGLDVAVDFGFSDEVIDIQFPEIAEIAALDESGLPPPERVADADEIAKMKEMKKAAREEIKAERAETGDYNTEAKGVVTIVFDRESAKKQWFLNRGMEEPPNVMHINEFEKLLGMGATEDETSTDGQD